MEHWLTIVGWFMTGLGTAFFLGAFATAAWLYRKLGQVEQSIRDLQRDLDRYKALDDLIEERGTQFLLAEGQDE